MAKGAFANPRRCRTIEYEMDEIHVNRISPTGYGTARSGEAVGNPEFDMLIQALVPLGRRGEAADVARTAVFLAADEVSFLHGDHLRVDRGGMVSCHLIREDDNMRKDIAFQTTDGTTLRGWHFLPAGSGKHATIVMAHGFSAVKEMYLDKYAEAFARAGFASVVYDHRNFGASEGQPRQEIDPWLQIRDYSDAITFALSLEQTDAARIGIWGSSYSGGHVLVVAAIDRRVRCVVSQVPAISGSQGFRRLVRADFISGLEAQLHADRVNRAAGGLPAMIPVVAQDPTALSALPTADSYQWFTETAALRAPSWRNEVTARTLEYGFGYEPGAYVGLISPTPLLLLVAVKDHLAVSDLAIAAYERAYEPKRLILLPGGHFDAYGEAFDQSLEPARDWFRAHLGP